MAQIQTQTRDEEWSLGTSISCRLLDDYARTMSARDSIIYLGIVKKLLESARKRGEDISKAVARMEELVELSEARGYNGSQPRTILNALKGI